MKEDEVHCVEDTLLGSLHVNDQMLYDLMTNFVGVDPVVWNAALFERRILIK